MLGNWGFVALAEAVDLARSHSRDCNHLAAIGVGRYKGAVMVVVVAVVVVAVVFVVAAVVVVVAAGAAVAEGVGEGYEGEGR